MLYMLCVGHSCARCTPSRSAKIRFVISAFALIAFFGVSRFAWCASVDLGWDPAVGNPLVTGYEVHYGLASGQYDFVVEANLNGAATSTKTVENLLPGHTYYFAVRSCNHDPALVSAFSNEVSVTVSSVANQPPVVTNPGPQFATEGDSIALNIVASDEDGDALAYSTTGLPAGLNINAANGSIGGTLASASAGNHSVTVTVSDGSAQANTSFTWAVSAPNHAPVITNPGPQSGNEGDAVALNIVASDEDGDTLAYSATGLPAGLSIDGANGTIGGTLADGNAGTYNVAVTVSDGSEQASASFDWVIDFPSTIRTEAGMVLGVTNAEWMLVTLEHSYDSMVVVATPRYSPSAPPQIVRVRNASGSSFELGIARADGSAGAVSTTVDYLVVEEGVYDAATHGVTMEAVKYRSAVTDSQSSWAGEWQTYANSYTNPVVIGQVMSANDPRPSSFWARGSTRTRTPDASTLYTGKTVSEDPELLRDDELIGYIVIEAGTGILGDRHFEAGVGADSVRGMGNAAPYEYSLGNLLSAEVALLSMAAMDGADGGWPVLAQDLDPSGSAIGLAVDEDQLSNSERNHTTEQIAYLVLAHTATDVNQAPLVTTPAPFGALEGAAVSLQIEAMDLDGDELSYRASGLPLGLSIDLGTGLIEGTIGMGQSGMYEVIIEVDDGTDMTDVSFGFAVAMETASARADIGVVTQVSSETWTEVMLPEIYASMVVVTTPSYTKDDAPAVVQIRNAFGNSFEVRMARRDGGTDPLLAEVHFLVVEEGVYNAAEHGTTLEAVKYTSTITDAAGSWIGEARTYANAYTMPVVLGQVMSANDDAPSSFWTCGGSATEPPSAMGLGTGKTVAEDPDGVRADETIGYVVIEAGVGSLDGLYYGAATGADAVVGMGDQATPISYSLSGFGSASVAIATVAGMDGGNGGWAVLHEPFDTSGASLALGVDEDTLRDSERRHTTEQVGYIVFE